MGSKYSYLMTLFLLALLLLSSCGARFHQPVVLTDVPISVSQPNSDEVDLDVIMSNVEAKTKERLPNAYFGDLVFSGSCQELPNRQGRIVITFKNVSRPFLFTRQDLLVTASITTSEQIMAYDILDYSEFYLNIQRSPRVTNQQFKAIAHIAHQHIGELGLSDCDVTITQTADGWIVRCGRLENMVQKCRFIIDSTTGEIKNEGQSS